MAKTKTRPWDAAQHLKTDEDIAAYLEAALDEGDTLLIAAALGDIARAKGIGQTAGKTRPISTGLSELRSSGGQPDFATVLKVVRSLGIKLRAEIAPTFRHPQPRTGRHRPYRSGMRTMAATEK